MIDAATLKLRYPAFASVPDQTITYWLTDAGRTVDTSWDDDQEPATLALAAHNMSITPGVVPGAAGIAGVPAGLTSFKSASVSLTFSETAAQAATGGYGSTVYGREFQALLRLHSGGPMLVGSIC